MARIYSPAEGYTGETWLGPVLLKFEDGVAEVDDDRLSDGARAYLRGAGYGIDGSAPEAPAPEPEPLDPRTVDAETIVGTELRDAAVDPRPEDFLAPTNAGKANPHGPEVVSPELHASQGVRPVKGGDVHTDETDLQDAQETAHADAATDGTPVTLVPGVETPKGNASTDEWREYALARGALVADVDGKTREELKAWVAEQDKATQGEGDPSADGGTPA